MKIEKQEIVHGGSFLRKNENFAFNRVKYMVDNMSENLAYISKIKKQNKEEVDNKKILEEFKLSFKKYRSGWVENPKKFYNNESLSITDPLCLDIESAAICDLACPHCHREHILTPDKIMDFSLYKKIIDSAVKLKVPSIKLNWRGEPLLNPKLEEFIKYAKENGILEVSINTNATQLTKARSKSLIEAGLDLIIYSFDGGTKETYEKYRPSRFKKNKFEKVYENIKNFKITKDEMKKKFPVSKIQMILMKDTRNEVQEFFNLFNDIVDDVAVQQYTERGGNIEPIKDDNKSKIEKYINKNNLSKDTPYSVEADGNIYIAIGRKPCEQLLQRLMITYDGRVGMCCHDWGAQHCLGYIDKLAFNIEKTIDDLEKKIINNKKGFELLKNAKKQNIYNDPEKKVQTIEEIWKGEQLNKVRNLHKQKLLNNVEICKKCDYKNTYEWQKI